MSDFMRGVYRFAEVATDAEIKQKIAALRIFAERLKKAPYLTEGELNALQDAERSIEVLEEHLS